jgi:hypothetical protein
MRTLLEAAGMAQGADEPLDPDSLAKELESSPATVRIDLEQIQRVGLVYLARTRSSTSRCDCSKPGASGLKTRASRPGATTRCTSCRSTSTTSTCERRSSGGRHHCGGRVRHALLQGTAVEHVREFLVPSGFEQAVDERLTLNLYAAAVALMARLSDGSAAGCPAEEIMAVVLMAEAEAQLHMMRDDEITEEEREYAARELRRLFDLFQDDDVLDLFRMSDPADASRRPRLHPAPVRRRRPARGGVVAALRRGDGDRLPR